MSRYRAKGGITNEMIDEIFQGSIDMHTHVAPDPLWPRRFDTMETARLVQNAGMRAFVSKSYYYPTTTECLIANKELGADVAIPSITIGFSSTGGLEGAPEVMEKHAMMGCKVVWFPAGDARTCYKLLFGKEGGIYILDDEGKLRKEALEVLEICRDYGIVVCKGHMDFAETDALFTAAKDMGITKLVNTHPLSDSWGVFTMDQIRHLADDLGVYTEIVFNNLMPRLGALDPADYVDLVHDLGAERMILGTDLAQAVDISPNEGTRFFIALLLQYGCTKEEIIAMARTNPAALLDLQ